MSKKKRILASLLVALLVLPCVACANNDEPISETTVGTTTEATETETEFFPAVEKQDYNDETLRIIGLRTVGTWVYGDEDDYNKQTLAIADLILNPVPNREPPAIDRGVEGGESE